MSTSGIAGRQRFSKSFMIQMRVIFALMIREAYSKYSQETLGFFWIIAEPMLLTCGVIILWTVTGRGEARGQVTIFAMALTAYSHIQLWRQTVASSMGMIRNSGWLYYHQNVKMFDVFVAQSILISIGIFTSFVIVAAVGTLFDFMQPVRDPGLVVAAWCVDTLFCMSFATVVAGVTELSELIEKFVHPLMYLTLPLTGAFTLTSWLPPRARSIIDWSPLANACEMFRAGVFPEAVKTTWSLSFILGSALALFLIGIPLMIKARKIVDVR